ncbi:MAG: SpoVR family protein [Steroidobacteraceae bacterium]
MSDWRSYVQRMEELAARLGLNFHPVEFEAVPDAFMMEMAVYGLPVRMPHWSLWGALHLPADPAQHGTLTAV